MASGISAVALSFSRATALIRPGPVVIRGRGTAACGPAVHEGLGLVVEAGVEKGHGCAQRCPLSAETDPRIAAVAEAFRGLRLRAGLSLRQLAVKCNYSPATVSIAASGKSLPRWEVVEGYVRGCTSDEDELNQIRNLWDQAHAVQGAGRRAPAPAPGGANTARDGAPDARPTKPRPTSWTTDAPGVLASLPEHPSPTP
ncbi:helix-turn-helix domain-containing protein [Streptomyces bobili]|uniref:helix-turn-helix domain-containing protein n=1 Tax=Streptomyces bobili TaxID=67280 RepID=UPI0037193E8C